MAPKKLADLVAIIHLVWILFGLLSLPLLFFLHWWGIVVIIFASLTVLSWILFRGCWFLQLENRYRKMYDPGESFEEEAFLQHYIKKCFNINLSRITVRIAIYTYLALLIWAALNRTL